MSKNKHNNSGFHLISEKLTELRRTTLIASTAASTRLAGSKLTNAQVEKIMVEGKIVRPRQQQ